MHKNRENNRTRKYLNINATYIIYSILKMIIIDAEKVKTEEIINAKKQQLSYSL